MLTRSLARLWAPKYFHANKSQVAHRIGSRRTNALCSANPSSVKSTRAPVNERRSETAQAPHAQKLHPSCTQRSGAIHQQPQSAAASFSVENSNVAAAASTPHVQLIVRQAQELLARLSSSASAVLPPSHPELTAEATRNYVEFTARRDIFGPLRHRLPAAAPSHLSRMLPHTASSVPTRVSGAATPRLRVVPSTEIAVTVSPSDPPMLEGEAEKTFGLSDLVVFLQLYDSVNADDGQLLLQLMAEVHRQLFAYAAEQKAAANAPGHSPQPPICSENTRKMADKRSRSSSRVTKPVAQLPLPALLFTMSSLGIVEEAVLDLVTSAAAISDRSPARGGLLYRQLPLYSTEELLMLIIALHRFGHRQQPSMKAVTKALRASLYNKSTAANSFHRIMRDIKKRMHRTAGSVNRHTTGLEAAEKHASEEYTGGDAEISGGSPVRIIQSRAELQPLVLQMRSPLFLLLEALTATTLTVYRRTDVISFLSDLISVTAVMELSQVLFSARGHRSTFSSTPSHRQQEDAQEYVLFVAHQLLRAAKLTEEMELPQPLLSKVFAWSCTVSGKGVVVEGGEDSEVPSDRVAFYDHVTADLIKANRTD
ncbi:hypothetical protein ABL78_0344 [Leptomonas seymouri]|uniref:Uncharacterized protein n=1 Tax=Leptomonas seymouri TaxID=5684 RepID=A0A0N1IMS8_LEPSE|nr:hypothetical protein ABL78_0344 [Leptomonas seymouri]|eukprot:KPI90584.1 hypothetical protein ABL78_0344 [Leptomonas seymouri]